MTSPRLVTSSMPKEGLARALRVAAIEGDVNAIQCLIDQSVDVNVSDSRGWTPLMLAAKYNRVNAIHALCGAGADIHARNLSGATALSWAVRRGHLDAVTALLCLGGNPNEEHGQSGNLLGCALYRTPSDIAVALLKAGADPKSDHPNLRSPVILATAHGDLRLVEAFVAAGCEIDDEYKAGYTSILARLRTSQTEIERAHVPGGAELNIKHIWLLEAARFAKHANLEGKDEAVTHEVKQIMDLLRALPDLEDIQSRAELAD